MRLVEHTQQGRNSFLEIGCWIDYDLGDDNSVTVNGVWLVRDGQDDLDITYMLTPSELEQAQQNVIWQLQRDADRREAFSEDAADSMAQIAREEQALALSENERQRGVR